ncbi:esterase FE4-like [Leguminivora glycinivorella]|uniref:esterase FE4-like n=1 Tax=Leguminivora glycinivorella TaxID=1035111 RepID=UPI00200F18E1|nr:esterase FE4-like [Leguminivora glycinivorella]XP_048007306.1 esterase FE4-like [Leguminivora glycinivorella]
MHPATEDTKAGQSCVVLTKEGPIRGYIDKNDEGTCYNFKGIPYAKPPIGTLRFMPPQPIAPWTEELDCTVDTPMPICVGREWKMIGSEDCLYLEVITPNIKPKNPMPVMFLMPSFGFGFRIDELYDASLITNQDVVFVNCNGRLGPFGFLSINDISAPGNNGLKDLVMGLKWIQRNIHVFGGDPENVTIFGSCSGGSMVHFMMLSPMASGLFHKAIIQSATALNNWSLDRNPTSVVTELAMKMGIQTSCMVTIIEKIKNSPINEIIAAWKSMVEDRSKMFEGNFLDSVFKPCIEEEFEGQPAFLTRSPTLIVKSGNINKVPFIIGINDKEGEFIRFFNANFYDYKKITENVRLMVPKPIAVEDNLDRVIGQKILDFYSGEEDFMNEDSKDQYLQITSDFFFIYHVTKTVQLHTTFAPECPIFYYILTQAGEWRLPKDLEFFNSVGHHAEIPYIFRLAIAGSPPCKGSRDSVTTRSRVVKMWTNFAKYGNPTPDENDPLLQIKWDPVENANKLNYLNIGSELTKGRNPFRDRMAFWDDLLSQHQFLKILSFFQDFGMAC